MITYIALLRGINVGGHKKIKMTHLREMLQELNFHDVVTYIQSGYVVFKSDDLSLLSLEEKIEKQIATTFKFNVLVIVKRRNDLVNILKDSPFTKLEDIEANKIYYALLKCEPQQLNVANIKQEDYPNELFVVTKSCVYLNCLNGAGKAKLNNNIIEQKLKVNASTRNHKTMLKLIDLSS